MLAGINLLLRQIAIGIVKSINQTLQLTELVDG